MNIQRGQLLTGFLVVSVILNLLLVGAMVGRRFNAPPPPRSFPPTMGWVARGLEPEERSAIRPLLEDHRLDTIEARRALAAAQRDVTALLRAKELDEAALTAALGELRNASSASQRTMHEALVRVMAALTAEQRERVVSYMGGGWRRDAGRGAMDRPRGRMGGARERMPPPPPPEFDEPDAAPPDGE